MFALLQPILFGQIFLSVLLSSKRLELRKAFVKTTLLFFAFVAISTEALSFFNAIEQQTVTMWWLLANVGVSLSLFYKLRTQPNAFHFAVRRLNVISERWTIPLQNKLFIVLVSVVYTVVLLTAFSVPNTADSMTYHLARVAHWIQNQSVAFYPTAILRQLYQNPLAEYAILHLQLLSGDDHFANLVQYFCFIGCGISASLIAKEFGLGRSMQLFAVVVCATAPMAILQGSSTQNDLVVSLFTMLFLYFSILSVRSGDRSELVFAGLALGLALLTKGTALLFCFPIGVLVFGQGLAVGFSKEKTFKLIGHVAVIVFLALCLNAGHYYRNWELFGAPVTSGDDKVTNEGITIPLVASNLLRNYAVHLGSISDSTTTYIQNFIGQSLGGELNNPTSTYLNHKFHIPQTVDEYSAGNLIHVTLLSIACLAAFGCAKDERRTVLVTALSIIGGFFVYCLVLRWQPWASRLHLPLFMIGSPLIVWLVSKSGIRGSVIAATVAFVACLPALFFERPSPLLFSGEQWRTDNYFVAQPALQPAYAAAADFFRQTNVREIGLELTLDYEDYKFGDWEYPIWTLIRNESGEKPVFKHVGVSNVSNQLNDVGLPPEWVISTKEKNVVDGIEYVEVFSHPPLRILHRN